MWMNCRAKHCQQIRIHRGTSYVHDVWWCMPGWSCSTLSQQGYIFSHHWLSDRNTVYSIHQWCSVRKLSVLIALELGRQVMIWTSDLQDRILADPVEHSRAITEGITAVTHCALNILAGQVPGGQPLNPDTAGVQGICPQVCPGRLEFFQWFPMQCAIALPPPTTPHAVQSGGMVCLWYSNECPASEDVSRYQFIWNYCIMTNLNNKSYAACKHMEQHLKQFDGSLILEWYSWT